MRQATTKPKIIMQTNPSSPISEIYRNLRFNMEFSAIDRGIKMITITSANRGEGKTTTAVNLALASVQAGKKTVLVDVNLRNPAVHLAYGLKNHQGLSQYLTDETPITELIQETSVPNLSVITSGPIPPNPSDLLASDKMNELFTELKKSYDVILLDTPQILTLTDAKMMAAGSDGVLLVVEHGKLNRAIAKKIHEDLTFMRANLLGIVFNKINRKEAQTYLS